jgi:hypothetical protein
MSVKSFVKALVAIVMVMVVGFVSMQHVAADEGVVFEGQAAVQDAMQQAATSSALVLGAVVLIGIVLLALRNRRNSIVGMLVVTAAAAFVMLNAQPAKAESGLLCNYNYYGYRSEPVFGVTWGAPIGGVDFYTYAQIKANPAVATAVALHVQDGCESYELLGTIVTFNADGTRTWHAQEAGSGWLAVQQYMATRSIEDYGGYEMWSYGTPAIDMSELIYALDHYDCY